jgi:hypothetical protein
LFARATAATFELRRAATRAVFKHRFIRAALYLGVRSEPSNTVYLSF